MFVNSNVSWPIASATLGDNLRGTMPLGALK